MLVKVILIILLTISAQLAFAKESTCYGETKLGKLVNGVKLPNSGNNFVTYSYTAGMLGRTYVHSKVRTIFLTAYKNLETSMPNKVFKYAETGFKNGGRFKPHKTHQNGLSIDFMTPVINSKGESVHLPTTPLNKLGYSIEFTGDGEFEDFTIDYEALAAHIVELDKAAKSMGLGLWRVIFDPKLQPKLFETKYGAYLQEHIQFSKKRSWVRHDEHYHVDFEVPCKPF